MSLYVYTSMCDSLVVDLVYESCVMTFRDVDTHDGLIIFDIVNSCIFSLFVF